MPVTVGPASGHSQYTKARALIGPGLRHQSLLLLRRCYFVVATSSLLLRRCYFVVATSSLLLRHRLAPANASSIAVHPRMCPCTCVSGNSVCVRTSSHFCAPRGVSSIVTTDGRLSVYGDIHVNANFFGRSMVKYSPWCLYTSAAPTMSMRYLPPTRA